MNEEAMIPAIISYLMLTGTVILTCVLAFVLSEASYRLGQIDAIRGDVKYRLVERDGKPGVWRKIKRGEP